VSDGKRGAERSPGYSTRPVTGRRVHHADRGGGGTFFGEDRAHEEAVAIPQRLAEKCSGYEHLRNPNRIEIPI